MKTDDPIILRRIQEIERACEGLRMACGFQPLIETPETTAKREPGYKCAICSRMTFTADDLDAHMRADHSDDPPWTHYNPNPVPAGRDIPL